MSIRSVYGLSGLLTFLKQSVHSYTHAYFCLCTLQQHHHKNSHRNHQKRNNYFPGSRFTGINELLVLLVFLDRERGYFSCFWLETWLSSPLGDECEKIENNSHDAGHASEGERRWFWRLHMGVGGGGWCQRIINVAARWLKTSARGQKVIRVSWLYSCLSF